MKRIFLLVLFTALFVFLCLYQGSQMFQYEHNQQMYSLPSSLAGYDPSQLLRFEVRLASADQVKEFQDYFLSLLESQSADMIVQVDSKDQPYSSTMIGNQALPTYTQSYIFSEKDQLFPKTFFQESDPDWSRSGVTGFRHPTSNDTMKVNQLIRPFPELKFNDQLGFFPLATMTKYYENLSNYPIHCFILCQNPHALRQELENNETLQLGQIYIHSDLYPLESYTQNQHKGEPYEVVIVLLISLLSMIVMTYSLIVIHAMREIGIRRIHGQSAWQIGNTVYRTLNRVMIATVLISFVLSSAIVIKQWNSLTKQFMLYCGLMIVVVLVLLYLAKLASVLYIRQVRPAIASKTRNSYQVFQFNGFLIKLVIAIVLISQLYSFLPAFRRLISNYQASQVYPNHFFEVETSPHLYPKFDDPSQVGRTVSLIYQTWNEQAAQLGGYYMTAISAGGELITGVNPDGTPISTTDKFGHVVATYQLTQVNDVVTDQNQTIRFDRPPDKSVFLLPPGADISDIPPQLAWSPIDNDQVYHLKDNQSFLVLGGQQATGNIVMILSVQDSVSMAQLRLPDSAELKETIKQRIVAAGFEPDWIVFRETTIDRFPELLRSRVQEGLIIILFLISCFLLVSYHNAYVFFLDQAKTLHLRYLHGQAFWKRHGMLWALAFSPYALSLGLIWLFDGFFKQLLLLSSRARFELADYHLVWPTIIWILVIVGLIDIIIHARNSRRIERHGITLLKGEE